MKKFILIIVYLSIFISVFSQIRTKQYKYYLRIYEPLCSTYYTVKDDSNKGDTTFIYLSDCDGSIQEYGVITYISGNRKDTIGVENNVIALDKEHYNLCNFSIYADRLYNFNNYFNRIVIVYGRELLPTICHIYSEKELSIYELIEIRNDIINGKKPDLLKQGIIEILYEI